MSFLSRMLGIDLQTIRMQTDSQWFRKKIPKKLLAVRDRFTNAVDGQTTASFGGKLCDRDYVCRLSDSLSEKERESFTGTFFVNQLQFHEPQPNCSIPQIVSAHHRNVLTVRMIRSSNKQNSNLKTSSSNSLFSELFLSYGLFTPECSPLLSPPIWSVHLARAGFLHPVSDLSLWCSTRLWLPKLLCTAIRLSLSLTNPCLKNSTKFEEAFLMKQIYSENIPDHSKTAAIAPACRRHQTMN